MGKLIVSVLILFLTACSAQPTPTAAPTLSDTPIPTVEPTATIEPTPTPIPGSVVIPIEEMAKGVPWLQPSDYRPGSYFVIFNLNALPFNKVLVRQALAAATDRDAIVASCGEIQCAANHNRPHRSHPPRCLGEVYIMKSVSLTIPIKPGNIWLKPGTVIRLSSQPSPSWSASVPVVAFLPTTRRWLKNWLPCGRKCLG